MAQPQPQLRQDFIFPTDANAAAFDFNKLLAAPENDPLLPSNINAGLQALNQQYAKNLGQGSFAARSPIKAGLARAAIGALLGGLAGNLDSNVGAGQGALIGAGLGGLSTIQSERARKQRLATAYQDAASKVLEKQKQDETMRKDRSLAQYGATVAEGLNISPKAFYSADGKTLLAGLPEATISGQLEREQAGNQVERLLQLIDKGMQSGVDTGNAVFGANRMPTMQVDSSVTPPSQQQSIVPVDGVIQGGVQAESLRPLGATAITPALLQAALTQYGAGQRVASGLPIEAADTKSAIQLRGAQASEYPSRIQENKARADLLKKTNPNIRGGGGSNREYLNPRQQALLEIYQRGATDNATPEAKRQAAMAYRELAPEFGLPEVQAAPQETQGFNLFSALAPLGQAIMGIGGPRKMPGFRGN